MVHGSGATSGSEVAKQAKRRSAEVWRILVFLFTSS